MFSNEDQDKFPEKIDMHITYNFIFF